MQHNNRCRRFMGLPSCVDDSLVLHICPGSYPDGIEVTSKDCPVPDGNLQDVTRIQPPFQKCRHMKATDLARDQIVLYLVIEVDISNNNSTRGDPSVGCKHRYSVA